MDEDFKYQQDFLWFTYFGITWTKANADKEKALINCCNRAYRDLSRTLDYTHPISELDSKAWKKEEREAYISAKKKYRADVIDYLVTQCKNIPTGKEPFKDWHEAACRYVIDESKKFEGLFKKPPTYGQAQKWVNMTIKNMLVMGLWDMDELKPYLHIPLDSLIFKQAKQKLAVQCPFHSWSGIDDYKEYINYQDEIKKAVKKINKTAIDWEGPAWIEQSEIENQDD